jgi:hypothetical protein
VGDWTVLGSLGDGIEDWAKRELGSRNAMHRVIRKEMYFPKRRTVCSFMSNLLDG